MKKLGTVVVFACGLLAFAEQDAIGQTITVDNLDDPAIAKTIRTKYIASPDLPDGVSFLFIMRMVEIVNAEDAADANELVRSEVGVDERRATELMGQMLSELDILDDQINSNTRDMACLNSTPLKAGDEVFPLFEAMDDMRDDVATARYAAFVGGLEVDTAAAFEKWVARQKLQISHVKFDHKKHYERMGASADATIASMCDSMNQQSGGVRQ